MKKLSVVACLAMVVACGDDPSADGRTGTGGQMTGTGGTGGQMTGTGGTGGQMTGTGGTGGQMTGTGGTGGQPPACDDVCFWWDDPVPLPPPVEPGENVIDECNAYGLTPGICPSGFRCGRVVRTSSRTMPVCEPLTPGSITTNFDLPVPTPDDPRNVTLRLTINGDTWPVPASGKNAGEMYVWSEDSGWSRSVPLPNDGSGVVNLELATGIYRVYFGSYGADIDTTQFPQGYKGAWLEVVDHGEATANLERHQLDWTLAIDDVVETLADQTAYMNLRGIYTQTNLYLNDGDSMSGVLALFPDTYAVTSRFYGAGAIPQGTAEVDDMLALGPGQSNVQWDISTVEATGTILVDGQGFINSPTDVDIEFEGEDGARAETELVAGTPGTFSVRLLPGTYDVSLDVGYRAESRLPKTGVVLRTGYQTGSGPTDVYLHTQNVSGSVTLNDEQPADGYRGRVELTSRSGRATSMTLAYEGSATFTGVLFREGIYAVSIAGDGEALPGDTPPIRSNYRPTATPLALNVDAHLVTIPVTLQGSSLPDAPTESNRGSVWLRSDDSASTARLLKSVPATGAATVEMLVPEGTWKLEYSSSSSTYSDVPYGTYTGDIIAVSGPVTHPLDLKTVALTVNFTQGGLQPPAATPGMSRGTVVVVGESLTIPGTGPATVSTWRFPRVGMISLSCYATTTPPCDATWLPRTGYILGYGLELR